MQSLPPELADHVIAYLNHQQLDCLGAVCKDLYRAVGRARHRRALKLLEYFTRLQSADRTWLLVGPIARWVYQGTPSTWAPRRLLMVRSSSSAVFDLRNEAQDASPLRPPLDASFHVITTKHIVAPADTELTKTPVHSESVVFVSGLEPEGVVKCWRDANGSFANMVAGIVHLGWRILYPALTGSPIMLDGFVCCRECSPVRCQPACRILSHDAETLRTATLRIMATIPLSTCIGGLATWVHLGKPASWAPRVATVYVRGDIQLDRPEYVFYQPANVCILLQYVPLSFDIHHMLSTSTLSSALMYRMDSNGSTHAYPSASVDPVMLFHSSDTDDADLAFTYLVCRIWETRGYRCITVRVLD